MLLFKKLFKKIFKRIFKKRKIDSGIVTCLGLIDFNDKCNNLSDHFRTLNNYNDTNFNDNDPKFIMKYERGSLEL